MVILFCVFLNFVR